MTEKENSKILENLPIRIGDVVNPWAERSPDELAVVEESGSWTYGQLSTAINGAQSWLRHSGVRPGDRVIILCENSRLTVAIILALAGMDAWSVLVNAKLSAHEVDGIRDHCGARRVIYTTSVSTHARRHSARHGAAIVEIAGAGRIGIGPLNEDVQPEPIDPDVANNVAAMIYTSGTTGFPKGVMLTHRNLLFIAAVSAKLRNLTPADRIYAVLPMSHAVGLSVVVLGTLLSGAAIYLAPRFDPVLMLAALEKHQLTIILGVPSMFALLLEYVRSKGIASLRFPALRIISSSGAPLHLALKTSVEKLLGLPLHNGYGTTETSPNIAQTPVESPCCDTSVGRIIPEVEVKIVNGDGVEVPEGEVGELLIRGPNVLKGYYRDPEATAAAINEQGWFNSRDLAKFEKGYLYVVGRTKELIIRFGFNVYPAEVELALSSHPAVLRAAVIGTAGVEDEEVIAFVQLSEGSNVAVAELAAHAAGQLTSYKQPSKIFIVKEMPATPTGKVKKDELAKMFALTASSQ